MTKNDIRYMLNSSIRSYPNLEEKLGLDEKYTIVETEGWGNAISNDIKKTRKIEQYEFLIKTLIFVLRTELIEHRDYQSSLFVLLQAENKLPQCSLKDKINTLHILCRECRDCELGHNRIRIVFDNMYNRLEIRPKCIMVIGEAPGAKEDERGTPFVGRSGKLLMEIFKKAGFHRNDVYITNLVKCRPPENRKPCSHEIICCSKFLFQQIALIQPKIILTVGSTASSFFLNTQEKISLLVGKFYNFKPLQKMSDIMDINFGGIKIFPVFHPSYLLRNRSKIALTTQQLKYMIKELYK